MPLVLQTVRNFPGPWPTYLNFGSTGERDPRSVGDAFAFVLTYWTETPWPVWLYVVAAVVLVVVAAVTRDARRRLAFVWLLGSVVLQTALAVVYAYKGVDLLDQRYIEEFYKTVPLVVVLGAVTAAGSLLVSVRAPAIRVPDPSRRRPGGCGHGRRRSSGPGDGVPAAGRPHLPGGGHRASGRPVTGRPADRDPASRSCRLAGVAGVAVQLDRMGLSWCVGPNSEQVGLLYTPQNVCREGDPVWNVTASMEPPPSGTTIWSGETVYVPMWLSR